MGFRLIPIGGAGIHEGLQLRGTHKVAVSGNLCVLLNACEEARAHAEVAAFLPVVDGAHIATELLRADAQLTEEGAGDSGE